jgi:hypothetical protein
VEGREGGRERGNREGSKAEVYKDGEREGGSGRSRDFPTKPINKKVGEVGGVIYTHGHTRRHAGCMPYNIQETRGRREDNDWDADGEDDDGASEFLEL